MSVAASTESSPAAVVSSEPSSSSLLTSSSSPASLRFFFCFSYRHVVKADCWNDDDDGDDKVETPDVVGLRITNESTEPEQKLRTATRRDF